MGPLEAEGVDETTAYLECFIESLLPGGLEITILTVMQVTLC